MISQAENTSQTLLTTAVPPSCESTTSVSTDPVKVANEIPTYGIHKKKRIAIATSHESQESVSVLSSDETATEETLVTVPTLVESPTAGELKRKIRTTAQHTASTNNDVIVVSKQQHQQQQHKPNEFSNHKPVPIESSLKNVVQPVATVKPVATVNSVILSPDKDKSGLAETKEASPSLSSTSNADCGDSDNDADITDEDNENFNVSSDSPSKELDESGNKGSSGKRLAARRSNSIKDLESTDDNDSDNDDDDDAKNDDTSDDNDEDDEIVDDDDEEEGEEGSDDLFASSPPPLSCFKRQTGGRGSVHQQKLTKQDRYPKYGVCAKRCTPYAFCKVCKQIFQRAIDMLKHLDRELECGCLKKSQFSKHLTKEYKLKCELCVVQNFIRFLARNANVTHNTIHIKTFFEAIKSNVPQNIQSKWEKKSNGTEHAVAECWLVLMRSDQYCAVCCLADLRKMTISGTAPHCAACGQLLRRAPFYSRCFPCDKHPNYLSVSCFDCRRFLMVTNRGAMYRDMTTAPVPMLKNNLNLMIIADLFTWEDTVFSRYNNSNSSHKSSLSQPDIIKINTQMELDALINEYADSMLAAISAKGYMFPKVDNHMPVVYRIVSFCFMIYRYVHVEPFERKNEYRMAGNKILVLPPSFKAANDAFTKLRQHAISEANAKTIIGCLQLAFYYQNYTPTVLSLTQLVNKQVLTKYTPMNRTIINSLPILMMSWSSAILNQILSYKKEVQPRQRVRPPMPVPSTMVAAAATTTVSTPAVATVPVVVAGEPKKITNVQTLH